MEWEMEVGNKKNKKKGYTAKLEAIFIANVVR